MRHPILLSVALLGSFTLAACDKSAKRKSNVRSKTLTLSMKAT